MWFDRGPDKSAEDIRLVDTLNPAALSTASPADADAARQLVAACFSNAGACLLRAGLHADAVYACGRAIGLDSGSARAHYRRAGAHAALGTTADLELAVADLEAAVKLEPGNVQ
eukprot:358162-Chlamydomonas_euryale.AAC.15